MKFPFTHNTWRVPMSDDLVYARGISIHFSELLSSFSSFSSLYFKCLRIIVSDDELSIFCGANVDTARTRVIDHILPSEDLNIYFLPFLMD